jgi:cyclopropane-fatty-acyl-phospholipid synthase
VTDLTDAGADVRAQPGRAAQPGRRVLRAWGRLLYGWVHRRRENRPEQQPSSNISAHYDLGNDVLRAHARPDHDVLLRVLRGHRRPRSRRRSAKLEMHLSEAPSLKPERSRGRDRHGLGRLRRVRGASATAAGSPRRRSPGQQHAFAVARIRSAPGSRTGWTVLCEDYRDLSEGSYDKLVSIEMIEAVGHQYFDVYFEGINRLLRAGRAGAGAGHPHRGAELRGRPGFRGLHQALHLPGGLPAVRGRSSPSSVAAARRICGSAHLEDIGAALRHARCALWRERVDACSERILGAGLRAALPAAVGLLPRPTAKGGFRERSIGTVQLLLSRPRSSVEHLAAAPFGARRRGHHAAAFRCRGRRHEHVGIIELCERGLDPRSPSRASASAGSTRERAAGTRGRRRGAGPGRSAAAGVPRGAGSAARWHPTGSRRGPSTTRCPRPSSSSVLGPRLKYSCCWYDGPVR